MDKDLYLAAMQGNVDFLREVRQREIESGCWGDFFQTLTPQKNNIIHIASIYDQFEFLTYGFNCQIFSPLMNSQRNTKGDTPLHVASKRGNKKIVELLVDISKKFVSREVSISNQIVEEGNNGDAERKRAWRVKNLEGNTPLHGAIIQGKLEVAKFLVEFDAHLASLVNNNGETPLHLSIKYNLDGDKKSAIDMIDLLSQRCPSLTYKGSCYWSAKEKDSEFIIRLLQIHKDAAYIRDNDGLTPLLRAALQSQLHAIEVILNECPEASEICDPKGKTILHLVNFQNYEEAKYCMTLPHILALKDEQDDMGNTPAHIAVMKFKEYIDVEKEKALIDHHIGMIRALLESSTNFTLENLEGLSAATLFQTLASHFHDARLLLKLDMEIDELVTKNKHMLLQAPEEFDSTNEQKHSKDELKKLWEAVEYSDLNFLRQEFEELESWLSDGLLRIGDLLHILLQACKPKGDTTSNKIEYGEVEEFMADLLEKNPVLLSQINSRGDTFLHIMARDDDYLIGESFLSRIRQLCGPGRIHSPPWKVKNKEGNTPLHEALLHAPKGVIVRFLLGCDRHVASYVNNKTETPLHVLGRRKGTNIDKDLIEEVVQANVWATSYRDADGLTPLLRAAKEGMIDMVIKICELSCDSAQLRDHDGKTFLHMMDMSQATEQNKKELLEIIEKHQKLQQLLTAGDIEGSIPLDQAIKSDNYGLYSFLKNINNPFKQGFWQGFEKAKRGYLFGLQETTMKDCTERIGVIAVLMATIAVQAAFQPPGGIDDKTGNPKLLAYKDNSMHEREHQAIVRAAFWAFMVSDILTLCFSLVILLNLVKVLTGAQMNKLAITDHNIQLLMFSFVTARLSLMMGVFASTFETSPQLAIFTIIACYFTTFLNVLGWIVSDILYYLRRVTKYLIKKEN